MAQTFICLVLQFCPVQIFLWIRTKHDKDADKHSPEFSL